MDNSIENAEQYTAEEKELARQARKYLEDNVFSLLVDWDSVARPSEEMKEFLVDMRGFEDALIDAEGVLNELLIEVLDTEYLAEETEA
jgi:hypothetical protein